MHADLVGRGPPFAYWRKVGLQAYTKICSGVLCNIVVNIVMLLHIRVVIIELSFRGDNAVCVSAEQLLKICTCIASGAVSMSWAWPALCVAVQAS